MKLLDLFKEPDKDGVVKTEEGDVNFENVIVAKVEQLWLAGDNRILPRHRDWFVYDRFVTGDHWIVFSKALNTIVHLPETSDEIRRTVNKVRSQLRAIKNFILRYDLMWQPIPGGSSDVSMKTAEDAQTVLKYYDYRLDIKELMGDLVSMGLKRGIGILETTTEKQDEDNVEDIVARVEDP